MPDNPRPPKGTILDVSGKAIPAPAPAPAPDLAFGPPDDYRYREARPTTGGAYTIAPSEDNPGAWFWAGPGTAFNYVATEAEAIAAAQAHNRQRLAGEG